MTHLLVTNDFPPKVGGIQSYLYELWRRIPSERFAVLTTSHPKADEFDRASSMQIRRLNVPVLLPSPKLRATIDSFASDIGASLVVLDPALPLGAIGKSLSFPYAVVLHGAEVTVPARLPLVRELLKVVLRHADLVIAAGGYPAGEARRLSRDEMPRTVVVPPGVDTKRFVPLSKDEREATRRELLVKSDAPLVVAVSRLVPRKGMDVLIEAAAELASTFDGLVVLIGGVGRDGHRLSKLAYRLGAPVRFLGRVSDELLPRLYGAADLSVMLCRDRWLGLEQEGFGIVYLEAAATGVAQVAGRSGGAAEAVVDKKTGLIVDRPGDLLVAKRAIAQLLGDEALRREMGRAARERAVASFDYEILAGQLAAALGENGG